MLRNFFKKNFLKNFKWILIFFFCTVLIYLIFQGVFSFQCKSKILKNWLFYVGIYDKATKEKIGSCYRKLSLYPLYQCQVETPSKDKITFPAYITNKQFFWLFEVSCHEVSCQDVDVYTACRGEVVLNKYCVIYKCN